MPAYSKKAMIGYFLGNLGEMNISNSQYFSLVRAADGIPVYTNALTARPDLDFNPDYSPKPYQNVLEADFTGYTNSGEYQLQVPGMGASLPFLIHDGVAMDFTRAYALGLYHQRCGTNNGLPYTRFAHAACHVLPALVPDSSPDFDFTWQTIANYSLGTTVPGQGPVMSGPDAQLFPFQKSGAIDVSGGHHDAGDYSKYTMNVANLIHALTIAADAFPGVGQLDNLGIPESGDGKSDVLQEAKWEADFLMKLQDNDGGFYFLVYPQKSEYESAEPDDGIQQVVWPKTTAATAASVAALAQLSSSPLFRQQFPGESASYLSAAKAGWTFLTNAFQKYGEPGSYQSITFYGNTFTHTDEMAWASCEMYLATGDPYFFDQLRHWMPSPGTQAEYNELLDCFGHAMRSYTFAAKTHRLPESMLDASYFTDCSNRVMSIALTNVTDAQACAYGTSILASDRSRNQTGWYFSTHRAFDIAVGYALKPDTNFMNAIIGNLNYEAGCNPVNVCFVSGLGWKRQREYVDQFYNFGFRTLPPSGIPEGNIQNGFEFPIDTYVTAVPGVSTNFELPELTFPSATAATGRYPLYDCWSDSFNTHAEHITVNIARGMAALALVAAQTSLTNQLWNSTKAEIQVPALAAQIGVPASVYLKLADTNLAGARIVWEARDQEPSFGTNSTYTFTPVHEGPQWVEAEVQWPDGRRAFATNAFSVGD
jgi:glycosyl hydrolase family 9